MPPPPHRRPRGTTAPAAAARRAGEREPGSPLRRRALSGGEGRGGAPRGGLGHRSLGLRGRIPSPVSCKAPRNPPRPSAPAPEHPRGCEQGTPGRRRRGRGRPRRRRRAGGSPAAGKGQLSPAAAAPPAQPCPLRPPGAPSGRAAAEKARVEGPVRGWGRRLPRPAPGLGERCRLRPAEVAGGARRCCLGAAPGSCGPRHLSGHPRGAPRVSPQPPGSGGPSGAALPAPAPWGAAGVGRRHWKRSKTTAPLSSSTSCLKGTKPPPPTRPVPRGSAEPGLALAASPPEQERFQAPALEGRQARPRQARIWPCREQGSPRPPTAPPSHALGAPRLCSAESLSAFYMHPHGY